MISWASRLEICNSLARPKAVLAVDDAEVDCLGPPPYLAGLQQGVDAEHFAGGPGVNVLVLSEGVDQHRVLRKMGQDPQLDLRIVRGEQLAALVGNEGRSNLGAKLRADGDVLQVGIAAGQPPGSGHRLVEGRMNPLGPRIHQAGKGVHVSGLELGDAAILQHQARHLVVLGQVFQHLHRGGVLPGFLESPGRGQVEFLKENLSELLGRIQVELGPGHLVDPPGKGVGGPLEILRHFPECGGIDPNPVPLQFRQDLDQRQVDLLVSLLQTGGFQLGPQVAEEPLNDRTAGSGVGRSLFPQQGEGDFAQAMVAPIGLQQVGDEHGVSLQSLEPQAEMPQRQVGRLGIVKDLADSRIFPELPEILQAWSRPISQVEGPTRFPRHHRQTAEAAAQRIFRVGFQPAGAAGDRARLFQQGPKLVRRVQGLEIGRLCPGPEPPLPPSPSASTESRVPPAGSGAGPGPVPEAAGFPN